LVAAVQRALVARGAVNALVTPCGCLGPCFDGPNAVVYPDATWYAGLQIDDAEKLADHLTEGRAMSERLARRPGADAADT
jgi:(2Fe-2S) ferredoxin